LRRCDGIYHAWIAAVRAKFKLCRREIWKFRAKF